MTGSGRAVLRSTSAALACRNTRTQEARNIFGRGGLLGDGTRTGYLPHVSCCNIRRGRPHTHARTHFTHARIHTRAHTHTRTRARARTHTHTHIYIYIYTHTRTYTQTIRARIYARADTHTHTHTHTLCA